MIPKMNATRQPYQFLPYKQKPNTPNDPAIQPSKQDSNIHIFIKYVIECLKKGENNK